MGLVPAEHVLVPAEADPIAKERSRKWITIKASGTDGSEMILILLTEVVAFYERLTIVKVREPSLQLSFSVAGWLRAIGLSLEEQIHADFCHCLKIFGGVLSGSRGRDWNIWR